MQAVTAGHTVLAPNTEIAAALFDAVERTHVAAGRDVWPTPRVRDFGGWLKEQHAARQLADAVLPRVLGEIEERELWRRVIDSSSAGRDFVEPSGAARAARRARRAIFEYGISPRALAQHGSTSEESRAFIDWNGAFDEGCRALGCISMDGLLELALPPLEPIVWIESPVWRPMARQWLLRHGSTLAPLVTGSRSTRRVRAASPDAELAAIGEWARRKLDSAEQFRAWICIPDLNGRRAEVIDALDSALAPQRFALTEAADTAAYAVAGGTPLADFAPVRSALEILSASAGLVSFERFSLLLRAPELQASASENSAAAHLDLLLRKFAPSEADLTTWLALAERSAEAGRIGPVAALPRLRGAQRTLEELRGNHPISRWVPAWVQAFELGPWALRQRWTSSEYQAAERFRELLGQLAAADAFFGSQPRLSAQRILQRAARDTDFQAQTGIPPVWVSGQLIDPWLHYDGIWVCGCDAERWPPAVEPIPLLPVKLQREAGVIGASPDTQLHFALELQSRWAARASQCVFSYADPGDGRAAMASPLLLDAAAMESTVQPRPHWRVRHQAAPPLEHLTDEFAPPFGAGERTRGVSTLKAQSRCAFRGLAETRLAALPLERPLPGFNDRERGELIHLALEHVWSALRTSSALRSISAPLQAELVDDAVMRALAKVSAARDPGLRWRVRERERMGNVLRKWLDAERRREPFEVEQLEAGTASARHAGLEFKVRIDRIDRLADGARVLIDYKTGRATHDWRGERPDNPQLPIYALLHPDALIAVAYGRVSAGDCGFVAETERTAIFKPSRIPRSTLEGMANFKALIGVWSVRIEKIAADFAAGWAAVAPTASACRSCRLQGLCRVPAALEESDSHE